MESVGMERRAASGWRGGQRRDGEAGTSGWAQGRAPAWGPLGRCGGVTRTYAGRVCRATARSGVGQVDLAGRGAGEGRERGGGSPRSRGGRQRHRHRRREAPGQRSDQEVLPEAPWITSQERYTGTDGDTAGSGGDDEGQNITLRPIGGDGEVVGPAGCRRRRRRRGLAAAGWGTGGGGGSPRQSPLRHGPPGQVAMGRTWPFAKPHQNRPALGLVCTRTRCGQESDSEVFGGYVREGKPEQARSKNWSNNLMEGCAGF